MMQKLLKEPLLHFLLLGGLIFAAYSMVAECGGTERRDRIVVSEDRVGSLAAIFQRTWLRPPTQQELDGLVEEYIKEEILYREALALGLDRDDLVIRRRMRQKMEFLNADLVAQYPVTEAELQAFLDANRERFRRPDRLSFQQIYFNPDKHGADTRPRTEALLGRLNADPALAAQAAMLGDPTLLSGTLDQATPREITGLFGGEFAAALAKAPAGRWVGPVASSYGLHLVRVTTHEVGGMPTLDESRPAVERDWAAARRAEAKDRFYQALRSRYSVEVEMPRVRGGEARAANKR